MKSDAIHHRKVTLLAEMLGIPHAQALGTVTALFAWAAKDVPDGAVGIYTDAQIAEACLWHGRPGRLIEGLLDCFVPSKHEAGFLQRHPVFRLVIHDWREHVENYVHERLERQGLTFWDGVKPRNRKHLPASVLRTLTTTVTMTTPLTAPKTVVVRRRPCAGGPNRQNKQYTSAHRKSVVRESVVVNRGCAQRQELVCSVDGKKDNGKARAKVLELLKEFGGNISRGRAVFLLQAAGWRGEEALAVMREHKPERVFACVRYAVQKSKRNLAGMVRRALEQGWTL